MRALLSIAVLICSSVQAQSWGPSLDGSKAPAVQATKPAAAEVTAPKRTPNLAKRRPVRSEPITMPAAPRVRETVAVPTTVVPAPATAVPPAPIHLSGCDAAGNCRDASGRLLQGGVGNTLLDANGKSCVRHGAWVQCQ